MRRPWFLFIVISISIIANPLRAEEPKTATATPEPNESSEFASTEVRPEVDCWLKDDQSACYELKKTNTDPIAAGIELCAAGKETACSSLASSGNMGVVLRLINSCGEDSNAYACKHLVLEKQAYLAGRGLRIAGIISMIVMGVGTAVGGVFLPLGVAENNPELTVVGVIGAAVAGVGAAVGIPCYIIGMLRESAVIDKAKSTPPVALTPQLFPTANGHTALGLRIALDL